MNKPVFPSYQELLNEEAVSVPDALRLDTQPNIANNIIATDVWTDRGVFEKEVEHLWPKVWQMVCRETALQKSGDYYVYDIARYSILLVRTESGELKGFHNSCLHRGRALKSGKGTSRSCAALTTVSAGIWMAASKRPTATGSLIRRSWPS